MEYPLTESLIPLPNFKANLTEEIYENADEKYNK